MADYKRMVSYMYQYEDGIKKKNIGYVRVEAKNGQCKITLHMQLLGQLDSIFPTYLIQRKNGDMELIYLGDTVLKNQVMDSKLSADDSNIMNSGYDLSDMGGLLIFLNDNVFFATEWDDKPIVASEVLEALKPKQDKEIPQDEIANSDHHVQVADTNTYKTEREQQLAEELNMPKYKLPRGWKTIERLQQPPKTDEGSTSQVIVEVDTDSHNESTDNIAQEVMGFENNFTENPFEEELRPENIFHEDENQENYYIDNPFTEQPVDENAEEGPELADHPTARHIFDHYPRIYPFEDNEITLCVKIEPRDIGLLPKEVWAFANNSFLMHGYYCYHHLIFAKMKNRTGCSYILGIPGIYHNREQFMARMFGFESFKSTRKRELKQGDFGYWYLPISL